MKFYLISDNMDTWTGMRLAGIDGVVVHEREEVLDALKKAQEDPEVAIVLMTVLLVDLCRAEINEKKLRDSRPLIVEVPDRHGQGSAADSITRYIREAVGIRI